MAPILEVRNLRKKFGGLDILKDVNVGIDRGDFLVLVGPSGCGKSTLLNCIAGLEPVSGGTISIDGRDMSDVPPKDRDIAMVFQSYALYPNMTVYENIRFPLKVRGIDPRGHDEKVRRASALVELDDFLHRRPAELSGGQRQRVALARAIVREPAVFLMDEPLSNLDAKLRVSTRAHIKNLSHELAVTTIYVTHDQIEAMTLADRVVIMNHGVVQQVGTPVEIYDRPANAFVAGFIGNPAMNLIEGEVSGGVFRAEGCEISGFSAEDGKVTLGFRAEDVEIGNADAAVQIQAPIYTIELTGDATMVSIRTGGAFVTVKASKTFSAEIGDGVSICVPTAKCHLFDAATGIRVGG